MNQSDSGGNMGDNHQIDSDGDMDHNRQSDNDGDSDGDIDDNHRNDNDGDDDDYVEENGLGAVDVGEWLSRCAPPSSPTHQGRPIKLHRFLLINWEALEVISVSEKMYPT